VNGKAENEIQSEFTRQAKQMASAPAFHTQAVLERLRQAVGASPSDRILDLACGPGIVAETVSPHVREVVGIDATPEMIRLVRERFAMAHLTNGRFEVASAEWLPFEAGEFDQVLTRLSFHHFPDVAAVLAEIRRVLRPGGRMIVADVVSSEDADQSALHNSLERLRDPTHVRMLSSTELLQVIHGAGFSVMHEERWQQQRSFGEWAAIIADPTRTQPLEQVMRVLARAGEGAGISLREEAPDLLFTHTWLLVTANAD
jgi:ubiquinone/menaquinone biosynthesis C-methylase UbiE